MKMRLVVIAAAAFQFLSAGAVSYAANAAAAPKAQGTVVLDTGGMWRMHQTMQPPVARTEGGLKPLLLKVAWMDRPTAPPPADWMKADFDDHNWLRGPARLVSATPYVARLCLRGKFTVTDPAKVQDLKLNVAFRGGVVVYVNGQEAGRANVAPGAADLAEDYPAEAFLNKDGGLLGFEAAHRTLPANDPRHKMINRALTDLVIPSRLLRPGVNVVAVDVLRAAYPGVVDEKKDKASLLSYRNLEGINWMLCFLALLGRLDF